MPRKFIPYSRQHQKLLYGGLIKCYSAYLQSKDPNNITDSKYWTYRAKEELKRLYMEATKEIREDKPLERFRENIDITLDIMLPKNISIENKKEIIWSDIDANLRDFISDLAVELGKVETFSLALRLLSKEKAIAFTQFCIDYFIDHEIEMDAKMIEMIKESEGAKYTIACLRNRKCCITGKSNADIHHIEAYISRKYNPEYEKDLLVVPVSREVHNAFHSRGNKYMLDKYIITPVPAKLAKGKYSAEEINREIAEHKNPKTNSDYKG